MFSSHAVEERETRVGSMYTLALANYVVICTCLSLYMSVHKTVFPPYLEMAVGTLEVQKKISSFVLLGTTSATMPAFFSNAHALTFPAPVLNSSLLISLLKHMESF